MLPQALHRFRLRTLEFIAKLGSSTMVSSSPWEFFCFLCGIGAVVSLALYLIPIVLLSFAKPQDLRRKYGEWALVTGGSSGIGKALVRKLASQVRAALQ